MNVLYNKGENYKGFWKMDHLVNIQIIIKSKTWNKMKIHFHIHNTKPKNSWISFRLTLRSFSCYALNLGRCWWFWRNWLTEESIHKHSIIKCWLLTLHKFFFTFFVRLIATIGHLDNACVCGLHFRELEMATY